MNDSQIVDILVARDMLARGQRDDILREVEQGGRDLAEVLQSFAVISSKEELYQIIAAELGTEFVDLENFSGDADLLAEIPAGMARLNGALPLELRGKRLFVALVDPLNPQTVEDLQFALGKEVKIVVAPREQIEAKIEEYYGSSSESFDSLIGEVDFSQGINDEADEQSNINAAPIVRYVDLVLFQAIKERASDIHFEPFEKDFKIRYRVDGALYEMAPPPLNLANTIISRIKVMSNLNIAERRIPQDGRIMKNIDGKQVDLRVSTLPTIYGESVVLRVLDRSSVNLDLDTLKMPKFIHNYILETIEKPNGIFIVTGPTGAGKTTTLYACLREINTIDSKLLTAEDPVEYDIDGIIQVPVNDAIDLSFARILRAFLRQDPDRIMVGEMRDVETAQIAIQASLTGHLVFSTLHTNDSAGAVARLLDMGCEPFLVSATLEAVLAQRLMRTICPKCRVAYEPGNAILEQLGLSAQELGDKNFYTGEGCDSCNNTGYKGRKGIYELLDITDPLRELIASRAPMVVLKQKAIEMGMTTLREDGLANIYQGETTIEEVIKYT